MRRRLTVLTLILVVPFLPSIAYAQWQIYGAPVCTNASGQSSPAMVSDASGGAIVTWVDSRNENPDIYAQRVNAWGVPFWTADGAPLCTDASEQQFPTIISDGVGGAIVAWSDTRSGVYAQRVNAAGVPQWTADGVALCPGDVATIVSDGLQGIIATWVDSRNGNPDIYAQRVGASGAPLWATDGVALCTDASEQHDPTIASDDLGGAIVTWVDGRNGNADVYARRVDASGVAQWTADGIALCTAVDHQYTPKIVSDDAGGAIVAWHDRRSGTNMAVYARRVNAAGVAEWTADGVALSTAPFNDPMSYRELNVASDGAGGAIVTWDDTRNHEYDIYARRVSASGVPQWTDDGVALCAAHNYQYAPRITSDGAGGAIVTWTDFRPFGPPARSDIYAQRVDASGTPLWWPDGAGLSGSDATSEFEPTIVSDGASGAIVAWVDTRSETSADIYALRVGPDGEIPTSVGDAPPSVGMSLSPNFPNPFSIGTSMELDLSANSDVVIDVYNVAGRRMRRIDLSNASAGPRRVTFDGLDAEGRPLPSGVYFYRVHANGERLTRKMVIAR